METYVVRVYRREKSKPRSIVGIIEEVRAKDKRAFTTYDELWSILKSINKDILFKKEKGERCETRKKQEEGNSFEERKET